eukprot:g2906.t1
MESSVATRIAKLKVKELKKELKQHSLKINGKKSVLKRRLIEYVLAQSDTDESVRGIAGSASSAPEQPCKKQKFSLSAIKRKREAAKTLQQLTDEQRSVVKMATAPIPPVNAPSSSATCSAPKDIAGLESQRVVRVMAAAGSGKTFTIASTIRRLLEKGHKKIIYLVFNVANAREASEKLASLEHDYNAQITSCTVDAQARHCLFKDPGKEKSPEGDLYAQRYILKLFGREIEERCLCIASDSESVAHMGKVDSTAESCVGKSAVNTRRCKEFIALSLWKTFLQFLHSDKLDKDCLVWSDNVDMWCEACKRQAVKTEIGNNRKQPCTMNFFDLFLQETFGFYLWYPAKLWFSRDPEIQEQRSLTCPQGLVPTAKAKELFYVWMKKLWNALRRGEFYTYSSIQKLAQLSEKEMDGTALLVDEAQDLNPSQFTWCCQQARRMQLFFVGDAVQTIYQFRGSNADNLMNLQQTLNYLLPPKCKDKCLTCLTLTRSFRFGCNIASVANVLLLCKTLSKQHNTFQHYNVVGAAVDQGLGIVTSVDLLKRRAADGSFLRLRNAACLVVLCSTNSTIMESSLNLLSDDPGVKIGIADTGRKKFKNLAARIKPFFELFVGNSDTLPFKSWKGKKGLTWNMVVDDINDRDLEYGVYTHILGKLGPSNEQMEETAEKLTYEGSHLEKAVNTFVMNVLDAKFTASNADVFFSTIHSYKGLEDDTVQIVDDWSNRIDFSLGDISPGSQNGSCGFLSASQACTQMWGRTGFPSWKRSGRMQQFVNLWYVALTRARKTLSLPLSTSFGRFLEVLKAVFSAHEQVYSDSDFSLYEARVAFLKRMQGQAERGVEKRAITAAFTNHDAIYTDLKECAKIDMPNCSSEFDG